LAYISRQSRHESGKLGLDERFTAKPFQLVFCCQARVFILVNIKKSPRRPGIMWFIRNLSGFWLIFFITLGNAGTI
jgi:hypothetical protein